MRQAGVCNSSGPWFAGPIAGLLLFATLLAGDAVAGGQETGPPTLVFPFPATEQYRITCGYALPEATATSSSPDRTPEPADRSGATAAATQGCHHSGEPYNRFALDLQRAEGSKAAWRQPVLAAAAGTVSAAGRHKGLGWHVIIDHGGGYQTVYGHLVRKPRVVAGQEVQQGTLLGRVGSTGHSTGPHIHFVLWKDGVSINPEPVCGLRNLSPGMIVRGCTEAPLTVPSDFDGDGLGELVLLTESASGVAHSARVDFEREDLLTFGPPTYWPQKGETLEGVRQPLTGDFDDDGTLDIALLAAGPYCWSKVDVLREGRLDLVNRQTWWADGTYCARNVAQAASGDFDADGDADLALLYATAPGRTRIDVLRSDGETFALQRRWWRSDGYFADRVRHLLPGDFDADGDADLAAVYNYGSCETRVHVFLSNGNSLEYEGPGGWWKDEQTCAGQIADATSGDIDGDGLYDDIALLFELPGGRIRVDSFAADDGSFTDSERWSNRGITFGDAFLVAGDFSDGEATDLAIVRHADCSMSIRVLGEQNADGLRTPALQPDAVMLRNKSCDEVREALQ